MKPQHHLYKECSMTMAQTADNFAKTLNDEPELIAAFTQRWAEAESWGMDDANKYEYALAPLLDEINNLRGMK